MTTLPVFVNRLLFVTIIFCIASCKQKTQIISKSYINPITIQLIDSLGSITIHKPDQSDTFFTWIRRSDCGRPCEEGSYRFQPKSLPIFKESGFYWTGQPEDSVNQLTILHQRPDRIRRNNDSFAIKHYSFFKENLKYDLETTNIISDAIQKIGDRYFCIFKIADVNKKKGVYIRRLIGVTSVSGTRLQFRYDLLTQKQDSIFQHFFENSIKNLETVRIKDNAE